MNRWPFRASLRSASSPKRDDRRQSVYVPESARPVVTYEPYPTGAGPWAGHESRCKCNVCR